MAVKAACGNGFPLNIPSVIPESGGSGGTSDYSDLTNKPQINDVTLSGNKSLSDIGAASAADVSDIQDLIPSGASTTNKLATAADIPGIATTSAPGIVQPDGTSITIADGVISAVGGSGSGEIYSTAETLIGTWNGRNLYRKCYEVSAMPNSTTLNVPHGLGNGVSFFSCYGWVHAPNLQPTSFTIGTFANTSTNRFLRIFINGDNIAVETNIDLSSSGGTLIVEYVKIS